MLLRQPVVGHVKRRPYAQEELNELHCDSLTGIVLQASSGFFEVETAHGTILCVARSQVQVAQTQPPSDSTQKKAKHRKGKRSKSQAVLDGNPNSYSCAASGGNSMPRPVGGIVLGDKVAVTLTPDGRGVIEEVMPRTTQFSRKVAGKRRDEQVIAANLDQVVVVLAAAEPPMKETSINRYLAVAEYCGLAAVICINKADLVSAEALEERMSVYRDIGYEVIIASTVSGTGITKLRHILSGKTSALVGPSGVGKSSLISAVEPNADLEVGKISESTGKGRHTTTSGRLIRLEGGGYVADTPGMREFGFYRIPGEDLAWCFREFRPHIEECRFRDCTHTGEPGCGLQEAVEQGLVSKGRYEHYVRLREEMR